MIESVSFQSSKLSKEFICNKIVGPIFVLVAKDQGVTQVKGIRF